MLCLFIVLFPVVVVIIGILPAIFLKERFNDLATKEHEQKQLDEKESLDKTATKESITSVFKRNLKDFFHGFATTLKF